ncbi:MAG: right-handed parallel beta-helix repeat-containing protein [Phycisphaerales bacterium]
MPEGTGQREATFQLINGVTLKGGYAGAGTVDPNVRDFLSCETLLSGDLKGDDPYGDNNSHHVVTGSGTDPSAVLDGFTITGGWAVGTDPNDFNEPEDYGGGMYNYRGSPTLVNCDFVYNYGHSNGAVYNYQCSPKLTACTFILNRAWRAGGGMRNCRSNPILTNCHFLRNQADWLHGGGGGVHNEDKSNPTLVRCRFEDNKAEAGMGGGVYNDNSSPVLTNCVFTGNTALREYSGRGGAIHSQNQSRPALTNCLFVGNGAARYGGALHAYDDCNLTVTNCTFVANLAWRGNAFGSSYPGGFASCELYVTNSILWDGGNEVWNYDDSNVTIAYCNVDGGQDAFYSRSSGHVVWGEGNLNVNPMLTPDGHLTTDSPCIDAGDDTAIMSPLAWEDVDGESRLTDAPGPLGTGSGSHGIIDMGADEFHDSDRDCLPDWWEYAHFDNCLAADPNADTDSDGLSNVQEYERYGSNPNVRPIYVDSTKGSDAYDGCWSMPRGNGMGPKRTIQAGIDLANNGDTILVAAGSYPGPGNQDIDFFGRSIILRSSSGKDRTVIDCQGSGRAFHFHSGEMASTAVIGFTIQNGRADGGGAVRIERSSPRLEACGFPNNTSAADIHRLTFSRGYDFSQQRECASYEGDFYYYRGNRQDMEHGIYGEFQFAADFEDWGQRGLIDLGPVALADIASIPNDGYAQSNVKAVEGHSYVALAQEEEPDFCIVFRVVAIISPTVTIDWMYVDRDDWPNYTPPGGAIHCNQGFPILDDCEIHKNTPDGVFMQNAGAWIHGTVVLHSATWLGQNVTLTGDGRIYLTEDSVLDLDDSTIRCDVEGPGTIQVDLDSELIIEDEAAIDLQGTHTNGAIQCDGLLHVRGSASVKNAGINVTRARFEGGSTISNSVITAEAGSPYGQFFVEDTVRIVGNEIHADGDRYMDLDPSVFRGIIADNRIYVTITEGTSGTQGGLLELRAPDVCGRDPPSENFINRMEHVPEFNDVSWTIERLELTEGAKVNLTNRFDFGQGLDEVMYVKELVLRPGSVLNTSFNRLYYGNISKADSASIVNVPLLGFSLNTIAFDDEAEFASRVVNNNSRYVRNSPQDGTWVRRVEGLPPDPDGMMQMRNLNDRDPNSPFYKQTVHARAKGLFAKASEDIVLILFDYLFDTSAPTVELAVYLSDVPELQYPRDPDHYVEVARIPVPPPGRPGSPGSGRFGTFRREVPRRHLDFWRGTRVELELLGPEGCTVFVNDFDPGIRCIGKCGDVAGNLRGPVDALDTLAILSESGRPVDSVRGINGMPTSCLDSLPFCGDGIVTFLDALMVGLPCGASEQAQSSYPMGGALSTLSLNAPILIAGMPYSTGREAPGTHVDGFDAALNRVKDVDATSKDPYYASLVRDPQDSELYQLHRTQGLVRLSDQHVVIPPDVFSSIPVGDGNMATVYIGLHPDHEGSRPLQDVAFDAAGFAYVVPVVVDHPARPRYLTGAKIALQEYQGKPYQVVSLLPTVESNDNLQDMGTQEIEVGPDGYVYRLNAHRDNESDTLWVYDGASGAVITTKKLSGPDSLDIDAPAALHVSRYDGSLYLGSKLNEPDAVSATLYRISPDLGSVEVATLSGIGHITGIASDPAADTVWVVGYVLTRMPTNIEFQDGGGSLYTTPFYVGCVARVAAGKVLDVQNLADLGSDITLPLSVLRMGQ